MDNWTFSDGLGSTNGAKAGLAHNH